MKIEQSGRHHVRIVIDRLASPEEARTIAVSIMAEADKVERAIPMWLSGGHL